MNFFKKALVATAVVASFGATAADITPSTTILELSAEGIAHEVAAYAGVFDFNVKTDVATPASSTITVTFGADVDLTNVAVTNTVDNATTAGKGDAGGIMFDYGNGSFTFNNLVVDTDTDNAHFITFDVSLGQPIAQGAAFNVAFTGVGGNPEVGGVSVASYSAHDGTSVIDTGDGAISKAVSQFSFEVDDKLDAVIDRDDDELFTDATAVDTLSFTISNDESLAMSIGTVTYTAVATGAFATLEDAQMAVTGFAAAGGGAPTSTVANEKTITLDLDDVAHVLDDGDDTDVVITFTHTAGVDNTIDATGDVSVKLTAISADFTGGLLVLDAAADGGEWSVDATIINVPYLPVGYEGVQSTIQLANEGSSDVDVIVSAIDSKGKAYGPVNLDTLAGFEDGLPKATVSKLGGVKLMELLEAPAGSSLSITFNIDANEAVVNAYAYTQKAGTGRSEVSTSQQRAK